MTLEPKFINLLQRFRLTPERQRQRRSSGAGAHSSQGLGQSLDFSEYRPYQPGDDLRSLDWKLFGRTDRLYTKLYVPEQEETICFVIDRSASMVEKWPFLQAAVIGLATVALSQGDRIALTFLSCQDKNNPEGMSPVRGRSGLAKLGKQLQAIVPDGVTDLDEAFGQLSRRWKTRSHLIVMSDFLREGAGLEGLAQLHYRRHRLTCLQLLTPEELDPQLELAPGEWELTDPEPAVVDPQKDMLRLDLGSDAFAHYRQALSAHNGRLQSFARTTGAAYITTSTSRSLINYFSESLRAGGLLI